MFQYLVYHDGLPGKIRWKDSWILQHLPLCDSVFIFANGKLNLQYDGLFCFVLFHSSVFLGNALLTYLNLFSQIDNIVSWS